MSEDVKPKQFWICNNSIDRAAGCDDIIHTVKPNSYYREIHVIELEPTMRMIDEMAESFQEWLDDTEVDFSEQPGWKSCKKALEKYKKFKDGLK